MKKTQLALIFVLLFVLSLPVAAFELKGDLWSLSDQKLSGEHKLSNMYNLDLTLIEIGPVSLRGNAGFAGKAEHIADYLSLLLNKLDEQKLAEAEDFYLLGNANGSLRIDWPLFNGLSAIGSLGYQATGNVAKQTDTIDSGLYSGIVFGGGMGLELVNGLTVSGVYEIGPKLAQAGDVENAGTWRAWDVGLEYELPFVAAKVGYRNQNLSFGVGEETVNHYQLGGLYFGVGVHF